MAVAQEGCAMSILRTIFTLHLRKRLREEGSRNMREYDRAVTALSNPGEFDTVHAETIAPSIRKFRRRARAISKILRKIEPKAELIPD
jgi:hypothetical protein